MLQVNVINKTQRVERQHASGPLTGGRSPQGAGEKLVIDDIHVSREQFLLEEVSSGRIRLENRGRIVISLPGGTALSQGDTRELELPLRLTIGKTVVDILATAGESSDTFDPTKETLDGDSPIDIFALDAKRIGQSYPYPLAYTYRLLGGISAPAELYKEQLRLAENLVAFVASVSLSLLEDEKFQELNQKIQGGALTCWQGGISPGDWLSLAIHATERLPSDDDDPLAAGLVNLQINKGKRGFGKCVRDLITAKNDHKHDRGPSIESEYRAASEGVSEILDDAFDLIAFFENHPIRLVQDVNPRRRSTACDIVFLRCMGDHPGFEAEHTEHPQSLRKGDLYIERRAGQLTPLYPFIHGTICQQWQSARVLLH